MTKIQVILHTVNGDVTTTYGPDCLTHALSLIAQYTTDGKSFSVKQSAW
jgi:hypothetical protein